MNSLKQIQDQIRELSEDLNQKEVIMEQQLSEMLGGSLFTCET